MSLFFIHIAKTLLFVLISIPIYILMRAWYLHKRPSIISTKREIVLGIFILYVVALASQTIIPELTFGFNINTNKFYFDVSLAKATPNLIPFHSIALFLNAIKVNFSADNVFMFLIINILANVFFFSPLGWFIPYLWKKADRFWKIFLIGLVSSVFIETVQHFIGRTSDIDDVILNVCGVVIGYAIYKITKGRLVFNKHNSIKKVNTHH